MTEAKRGTFKCLECRMEFPLPGHDTEPWCGTWCSPGCKEAFDEWRNAEYERRKCRPSQSVGNNR
jgi:hypothetical protein